MAREDGSFQEAEPILAGSEDANPLIFPVPSQSLPLPSSSRQRASGNAQRKSTQNPAAAAPYTPIAEPRVEHKTEIKSDAARNVGAASSEPVATQGGATVGPAQNTTQTALPVPAAPSPPQPTIVAADESTPTDVSTGMPRGQLPEDLVALPLLASLAGAPIRLCVIARKTPDPIQGSLLVRRDLLDAKVYLGCLCDEYGVLQMLELWVQSVDGLGSAARSDPLTGDAVNNATLDDRWKALCEVATRSWPGAILVTGYEARNPPPTFFDVKKRTVVHPTGWELCCDDKALKAADLPPYSLSVHRYLYLKESADRRFVPLTPSAPAKAGVTIDYASILPNLADLVPFNPAGGLLQIKPAGNLRITELTDIIAGKKYEGTAYGKSRLRFSPLKSLLSSHAGHFFSPSVAYPAARIVESFYLRVRLLMDMVQEVASFTVTNGRPLLNLRPASFAVNLDDTSGSLPSLWTSRVLLVDAGDAIPIKLPQGDTSFNFCLPGKSVQTSFYHRDVVARGSVPGFGTLFISSKSAGQVLEGTLTVSDPIRPTARDIIRIRVTARGSRIDFYTRIEPGAGPSPSVLKFKSVPDERLKAVDAELQSVVGVALYDISFEWFPLFSSAADVYSLAALAVEVLLTRPDGNAVEQFRHLMALATRVRETHSAERLDYRIQAIFNERPDWLRWIGPQCLTSPAIDPDTALRCITPQLWYATLALFVQMLPQFGWDSFLRDFSDMVRGRMEGVYEEILRELNGLLIRSRSLMFGEWGSNRQVASILQEMTARPSGVE